VSTRAMVFSVVFLAQSMGAKSIPLYGLGPGFLGRGLGAVEQVSVTFPIFLQAVHFRTQELGRIGLPHGSA